MRKYLSCADTAKLVRQALKESFPGVKFSVRSDNYAGGASIRIKWMDGPTDAQVKPIADAFSGSYFDGMIDYRGSNYHELDGEPVHFGANYVFCTRMHSDALLGHAIEVVARSYGGCEPLTVAEFRNGAGHYWTNSGGCGLGTAVYHYLAGVNDYVTGGGDKGLEANRSPTLARVRFAGDDGYGAGTVGADPAQPDGEQCYKAIEATRARQPRTWGIYADDELVEGGFFDRDAAIEAATNYKSVDRGANYTVRGQS